MIWTFGAGGKLFAYQSGVLIVGMSTATFDSRDCSASRPADGDSVALLLLLVFLYWPRWLNPLRERLCHFGSTVSWVAGAAAGLGSSAAVAIGGTTLALRQLLEGVGCRAELPRRRGFSGQAQRMPRLISQYPSLEALRTSFPGMR